MGANPLITRAKVLYWTLRTFSIIDTIDFQRTFRFGWVSSLRIQWGVSMWSVAEGKYGLPMGWRFWKRNHTPPGVPAGNG